MFSLVIFIISNLVIFLGYLTVARFIVPSLNITYRSTKVGGFFFFLLCGLTHFDIAVHAWAGETLTPSDYTSWHMMLIHVPQAIAIWLFTWGLYKEIGREDGSFVLKSYNRILRQLVNEMSSLRKHVSKEDLVLLNNAIDNVTKLQEKLDVRNSQSGDKPG